MVQVISTAPQPENAVSLYDGLRVNNSLLVSSQGSRREVAPPEISRQRGLRLRSPLSSKTGLESNTGVTTAVAITTTMAPVGPTMVQVISTAPQPENAVSLYDGLRVNNSLLVSSQGSRREVAPPEISRQRGLRLRSPLSSKTGLESNTGVTTAVAITTTMAPVGPTKASTSSDEKRTFIITQTFGGQLTRAIKNMMMQQCWARTLRSGATLVEPFSHKSQLLHTPHIWNIVRRGQMQDTTRFSDNFDLEFYNQVSTADAGIPLVTWEQFLLRAPRQVVAVATPLAPCPIMVSRHLPTTVDKNFKEFLGGLRLLNFTVVKIVTIDCNRGPKILELVTQYLYDYTLAFSSWRNYNVARTWLDIDTQCDMSDKYPAQRLKPSSILKEHSENYRSLVLGGNKTIAIMLRVERFLTLLASGRSANETVDSCLDKTMDVFYGLKDQPVWSSSQPFLTLDIGRYGSGIMQNNKAVLKLKASLTAVTASVTKLLVMIYGGRWQSVGEWEDSFLEATGGIGERGYVAMLQRDLAVHSDCLILMGGGSFQEVAATHYLQAHPDPAHQCLHVVCAATAITTSLGKTRHQTQRMRQQKHNHQ